MRFALALSVVAAALGVAAPAQAQEWRPERPYRGLFGAGVTDAEQLLTAMATLGTGWDKNLIADFGGQRLLTSTDKPFRSGAVTGSGVLAYSLRRSFATLSASAGGSAYYYPRISRQVITREYVNARGAATIGYGFSAYGAASYQPFSLRNMFVTAFDVADTDSAVLDFPASREHYLSQSAGVTYNRRLTQSRTFGANYDYQHRSQGATLSEYNMHRAGARLTQQISRGLSFRMGYGYSEASYGDDNLYAHHVIDVGLNFNRALSLSRRTSVSFATGTSASRSDREGSLRFHLNGAARLSHEIGRTWGAGLSYAPSSRTPWRRGWGVSSTGVPSSKSAYRRCAGVDTRVAAETSRPTAPVPV
jgi:hypothetical protein